MLMAVTLKKEHTHAGRKYPAGAELSLPSHKAQWLIGLGAAVATEAAKPKTKAKPVEEEK